MLTANERSVMAELQTGGSATLSSLAKQCGLARSSTYKALQRLIEIGVVVIVEQGPRGALTFSLAPPAAIERAVQSVVSEFRRALQTSPERNRMKLVFTDLYKPTDTQLQRLRTRYDIVTFDESELFTNQSSFERRCAQADVIVRFEATRIDEAMLRGCPNLKAIVCATTDLHNVDAEACERAGVVLIHLDSIAEKYFATTQAEYVLFTLMQMRRSMTRAAQDVPLSALYRKKGDLGHELHGTKVGLVFTDSGITEMVALLRSTGCEVTAAPTGANPPRAVSAGLRNYTSVERLWRSSEAVVILDNVCLDLNSLLNESRIPEYLVFSSDSVRWDANLMRERILEGRVRGLAIDFLPDMFKGNAFHEHPQRLLSPIINLPNVIITPELSIFSENAFHRNYDYVFRILMDLDLAGVAA